MQQFLQSTHSYIRWLVLLGAVLAIALPYISNNQTITKRDKLPALFFMIICDIQLVIGLALYFKYSGYGVSAFNSGVGNVMHNADIRKIAVEHFVLMLIAFTFVHIGYAKLKNVILLSKLKRISFIYFGIALVLILAAVPWNRIIAA
jgi:hypothetical protein